MQTHFGPDFFTANRDRLRQALGSDMPVVITGNGVMQRGADEPSPFHQDSSFWYLTGIDHADLVLVMEAHETYLIVSSMSTSREAFDGAHDEQSYMDRSGITTILPEKAGWARIKQAVQGGNVATLSSPPVHLKQYGIYTLPYRRRLISRLKRMHTALELTDIGPYISRLRCLKQPEEIAALQQAIDITAASLQNVATPSNLLQVGYEYELEAQLSYEFRTRGATGHAFAPIVGAGKHSTTLHYLKNDGSIQSDDLIVLDIGAEVEHYAADLTRTVSKTPLEGRRAEVFNAVARVQDFAMTLIRPGTLSRDYEKAVEENMGEELRRLGLIRTATTAEVRRYFPHATSHFLGLDTHDVGDYRAPWQAGMVITCEPGIYIPEEGLGVRLEDDVLITETGHTVLSTACPRELTPVQ